MGDLSRHFNRREFRCGCGQCGLQDIDARVVAALESARDLVSEYFGVVSVGCLVTSGVRCPPWNLRVGGVAGSWHEPRESSWGPSKGKIVGHAADVRFARGVLRDWVLAMSGMACTHWMGWGVYPDLGMMHLDCRGVRARWGKVRGRMVPWVEAVRLL